MITRRHLAAQRKFAHGYAPQRFHSRFPSAPLVIAGRVMAAQLNATIKFPAARASAWHRRSAHRNALMKFLAAHLSTRLLATLQVCASRRSAAQRNEPIFLAVHHIATRYVSSRRHAMHRGSTQRTSFTPRYALRHED